MNGSRGFRPCRVLVLTATLFAAMVTTLPLPAYGQQEVDPTWYNPWAAPNAVAVHPAQPPVTIHRRAAVVKPVSSVRAVGKSREKRTATRPKSL
jgi:hypothetical protein